MSKEGLQSFIVQCSAEEFQESLQIGFYRGLQLILQTISVQETSDDVANKVLNSWRRIFRCLLSCFAQHLAKSESFSQTEGVCRFLMHAIEDGRYILVF